MTFVPSWKLVKFKRSSDGTCWLKCDEWDLLLNVLDSTKLHEIWHFLMEYTDQIAFYLIVFLFNMTNSLNSSHSYPLTSLALEKLAWNDCKEFVKAAKRMKNEFST